MNPDGGAFRVGVNYWPSRAALGWWENFDPGVVQADFARIADAGLDSVRFFCTWEAFQPEPGHVSETMLDRLLVVADLAEAAQLSIIPTLFTGHMSGVNLVPAWTLGLRDEPTRFRTIAGGRTVERHTRNWYDDATILDAQTQLARASATALAGHPALWAWDLGNENSNCSIPSGRGSARRWLVRVTDAIHRADPAAAITIGLHMEDLESDRHLGPADAAAHCNFLSMHGYPIYAPWADGATDEHLLGFLTAVTRWLGGGADVLFAEFGLPTAPLAGGARSSPMLVDETDAAAYAARARAELHGAGATGAMWWCANDYAAERWTEPPFDEATHERHFGLWRADGTPKPALAAFTAAGDDATLVAPPPTPEWIDVAPEEFFTPAGSHLARLYARSCAARVR